MIGQWPKFEKWRSGLSIKAFMLYNGPTLIQVEMNSYRTERALLWTSSEWWGTL